MLQGATGNLSTIAISVYRQVLIYGLVNRGTIVVTSSPCGTVFDKPSGFSGTRTHDLVVGSPNHLTIFTIMFMYIQSLPNTLLHSNHAVACVLIPPVFHWAHLHDIHFLKVSRLCSDTLFCVHIAGDTIRRSFHRQASHDTMTDGDSKQRPVIDSEKARKVQNNFQYCFFF